LLCTLRAHVTLIFELFTRNCATWPRPCVEGTCLL